MSMPRKMNSQAGKNLTKKIRSKGGKASVAKAKRSRNGRFVKSNVSEDSYNLKEVNEKELFET